MPVDSMSGEGPFAVLLITCSFVGRTWESLGSVYNPVQKLYFPIPAP